MRQPWRPLALAAVLIVTVGAGFAAGQTVIVRNAPPGSPIELVLNSAMVASAAAGADGSATLAVKDTGAVAQRDVRVYLDACGKTRRILLVERFVEASPADQGCDRSEIPGFFVARRVTTFVLDAGSTPPMVWLRQGPAPSEWLAQGAEGAIATGVRRPSPVGLVLSGGGGFARFADAITQSCGNVPDCSGKKFKIAGTASVAYWLTRFLAIEGSYLKPRNVTAAGSGSTYHFNSLLDANIFTFAGKVGAPLGPVRLYGQAGATYHRATSTTNQTIDPTTITVDGVEQTVPGGSETLTLDTQGWGWLFGGGIEGWVTPRFAIYTEVEFLRLKGKAIGGGDGVMDDRVTSMVAGLRVRVGPRQ